MLVYPVISYADHYAVCRRVEYHKLGLGGDIKRDTTEDILFKLGQLLKDSSYRLSLLKMKHEIEELQEQSKCMSTVVNLH